MREQMWPNDDWASIVFIRVFKELGGVPEDKRELLGYVFVKKAQTPDVTLSYTPQWKFPGGQRDFLKDRSINETARRETREETGIKASQRRFILVDSWRHTPTPLREMDALRSMQITKGRRRGPHWKCLFMLDVSKAESDGINSLHPRNGHETPKFFTQDDLTDAICNDDVKADHLELMYKWNLIAQ